LRLGGSAKPLQLVLDAVAQSPRLWVDHDFDGSVRDEKRMWMKASGTTFSRAQNILLPIEGQERPLSVTLRLTYQPSQSADKINWYAIGHRRGQVVIGGRLRWVALVDGNGDLRFDDKTSDRIYIDMDANGRFETTGSAPERVQPGVAFRAGEEGWSVRVLDPAGRRIELTRATKAPPARPRTWPTRGVMRLGSTYNHTGPPLAELRARYEADRKKAYASRYQTINQMRTVGTEEACKLLLEIAEGDSDVNVQNAAVRALGNQAYLPWAKAPVEKWARSGPLARQSAALQAMAGLGHPQAAQVARAVLEDGNSTAVGQAASLLIAADPEGAPAILLRAYDEISQDNARYGLYTSGLRSLRDGPPLEAMLAAVGSTYAPLRAAGLTDLQVLGRPEARTHALAIAKEAPADVSTGIALATVLGAAGDAECVRALLHMIGAQDTMHANVRKAALDQLRTLRAPKSVAVLVAAVSHKQAPVRGVVAELAGNLATPEMAKALEKQVKREKDLGVQALQLAALGDIGHPSSVGLLLKYAGKRRSKNELKSGVRASALRALARMGFADAKVRAFLLKLLKSPRWEDRILALDAAGVAGDARLCAAASPNLDHEVWQVRLAAIEALDKIRCRASIAPLIERLPKEEVERVRDALADALFRLTGQNLYDDADAWADWWRRHEGTFEIPSEIPTRTFEDVGGTEAGFYGIPVKTERVAFVIDQSGSMSAPGGVDDESGEERNRLDVAIHEVKGALARLPNRARACVIMFHSTIHPWKDALQKLNGSNRGALERHLDGMRPTGGTNLYDGLEVALKMKDVDTIFLLSDGVPGAGKYVTPGDILRAVRRLNQTRRIAIHTISIGMDSDLMKRLAAENGGRYVQR
jgi:HEAT repeat protein